MSEPAPDHAALIARLRTLARDIATVSSVAQRPAEHDKQMIQRLDEWSRAAHDVADALAALRGATSADEAPACQQHGVMVADDEFGRSWHCAVCDAIAPPEATE